MKTGLGLFRKYRLIFAYINLFSFWLRKLLIGFDVANQFIQRVDKTSLQLILKKNGAKIGKDCDIGTGLTFHNCNNYSNLTIGNNCHIGKNCFFDLRDKITIENNVVISMFCTFITHIDMSKSGLSKLYPPMHKPIIVHSDVYIGAKSTIIMGVNLGKRCFVAASSLIVKDVQTRSLVGGVPGKKIKEINGTKKAH